MGILIHPFKDSYTECCKPIHRCLKCESGSSRFQPGEGPSRGLLRDYEPSDGTFWSTTCNSAPGVAATFPSHWPSWTDRFICFFSCGELLDIFCCCCWTIYCSYSSLVVGSIDLPTSACLHPCAEQWGKCNIVFVISVCINSASIVYLKFLCNIIVWILYCLRSRPIYLNVVS